MRDVSHVPPDGDTVTNVWQRGRTVELDPDVRETGTGAAADDD